MKSKIPIFPLKIVVYPASRYPLHIFERRYKKMISECILKNSGFGVVSKPNEEISLIGTYVVISEILRQYPTGEKDIIVSGTERFRIIEYHMTKDGYYEADIEEYGDLLDGFDQSLFKKLRIKFEEILQKTNFRLEEGYWDNFEKAENKSFKIAEKSGMQLSQQQELLQLRNENERLVYLINHFENLAETISENMILKELVSGDGYIN